MSEREPGGTAGDGQEIHDQIKRLEASFPTATFFDVLNRTKDQAAQAAVDGDVGAADLIFSRLGSLETSALAMRRLNLLTWRAVAALLSATLLAALTCAEDEGSRTYDALLRAVTFLKACLADVPLTEDSDYDHAQASVLVGEIIFMLATVYVSEPVPIPDRDRITAYLLKSFARLFKNSALDEVFKGVLERATERLSASRLSA